MEKTDFLLLLEQYTTGRINPAGMSRLRLFLQESSYRVLLEEVLDGQLRSELYNQENLPELYAGIQQGIDTRLFPAASSPRIHFLKTAWFRYAAAILLIVGIGTAVFVSLTNHHPDKELVQQPSDQPDIQPGGNKAILTLADGSTIVLDSAANGNLALQGNARIVKDANGSISYRLNGVTEETVLMNTMSTPKGGQYQLVLPDGTKVWLNAASAITYPAAFVGAKRTVRVTGEAYFEVAKDKAKPFIVDVAGKSLIEVLGTAFNINAYANEQNIRTTLLEGSVKVMKAAQGAVLKPGQQAQILNTSGRSEEAATAENAIKVINKADLDKVMAWRNGLFNFEGATLEEVMKQLERWYDIEVVYEKGVPDIRFIGEMKKNISLKELLEILQETRVHFRLEDGRKLVVTP